MTSRPWYRVDLEFRQLFNAVPHSRRSRKIAASGDALRKPRFSPRLEALEDRVVPAFVASLSGTDLTLTGSSSNDILTVRVNAGILEFSNGGSYTSIAPANTLTSFAITGGGGNDTIDLTDATLTDAALASLTAPIQVSGDAGNDTLKSGPARVDFLYSGTNNGFDALAANGSGISTAKAIAAGTTIGLNTSYVNGVDKFLGFGAGSPDTIILNDANNATLNFSATELVAIQEIDAGAGNDSITAFAISPGTYRGGANNDSLNAGSGNVAVFWLYSGNANGFDTFSGNGAGTVIALAETSNTITIIGIGSSYANNVDTFQGASGGDTIIRNDGNNATLNFSATEFIAIQEIDAGAGNDSITASALSPASYRGGDNNDSLNAGSANVAVTWLYSGSANGIDSFTGNGSGVVIALAQSPGAIIGIAASYANGVDQFHGDPSGDTIIRNDGNNATLNFSETLLTNIALVDAGAGNDAVTTAVSHTAQTLYDGGANSDSIKLTFTPPQYAALEANPTLLAHVLDFIANPTGKTLTIPSNTGGISTFGFTAINFESASKSTLNHAPTNLSLDSNAILENAGANALVGVLAAVDPDSGDSFTFTLVSGTGSADNATFTISGNQLLANTSFDYETKSTYSVRIRVTDLSGTAFYETPVSISVTNVNEAPIGTDKSIILIENTSYTFDDSDFGFTDPLDAPPNVLLAVKIVTLPNPGSLFLNGDLLTDSNTIVSAADIVAGKLVFTPALNQVGDPYSSFTFQVQDDGGTTSSGAADLDIVARTMSLIVVAYDLSSQPVNPIIAHVGDPLASINFDAAFFDPQNVAAFTASSSDTEVVAVEVNGRFDLTFSQPGSATIVLTATAPNGQTVSTPVQVIVLPQVSAELIGAPVTDIETPYTLTIDPHEMLPDQWQINWGDGEYDIITAEAGPMTLSHTYASEGQRIIDAIPIAGQPNQGPIAAIMVLILDATNNPAMWRVDGVRRVEENAGQSDFEFKVRMVAPSAREIKIRYRTVDGDATIANNDYVAVDGELTFAPFEMEKPVIVKVNRDMAIESDEEFFLALEIPAFANGLPSSARTPFGRGFIQNDDGLPANDPWANWTPVARPNTVPQFPVGEWRKTVNGNTIAITTPQGPFNWSRSLTGEGPYLKYNGGQDPDAIGSFQMTIEWRAKDAGPDGSPQPVPPMPRGVHNPTLQQHNSNSGIYIYDRYEVQIVDPSKFTAGINGRNENGTGGIITTVGLELRDQLLPGGVYGTSQNPVPAATSYTNRANTTGNWNTMVIDFAPGTKARPGDAVLLTPARIRVTLNGFVVYQDSLRVNDVNLTGTGSRNSQGVLDRGAIYLQSHWGSQIEFRNPLVERRDADLLFPPPPNN